MNRLLCAAFAVICLLTFGSQNPSAQPLAVQQQALKKNAEEAAPDTSLEDALRPAIQKVLREELAREAVDETVEEESQRGASDPFADLIDATRTSVETLSKNFQRSVEGIPELLQQFEERAFLLLTDFNGWPRMWEGIFNLLAMLFLGAVAAWLLGRLLGRILTIPDEVPEFGFGKLAVSAILLVRGIVLVAVFAAVGFLVSLVWFVQFDPMRIFLITYLGAAATGYLG